jgi:mxaL protein
MPTATTTTTSTTATSTTRAPDRGQDRGAAAGFAAQALRQGWTLAALALLATALVLPPLTVPRRAQSFLLVFDITQSMGVADVRDDEGRALTRLDASKAAMRRVLRKLPCGSRVAWGVFTDYRSIPLIEPLEVCAHFDALLSSLDFVEPRMRWANASNVARGVYWALRATQALGVRQAESAGNAAPAADRAATEDQPIITVFFSDGHEAPPAPLDVDDLLRMPTRMPGLIVGVGAELASPIPRTDAEGRVIANWQPDEVVQRTDVPAGSSHEELSALNQGHLRAIGAKHGLAYARLTDADALHAAMLAAGPSRTVPQPTDLRWVPALLALACLVAPYLAAVIGAMRRRGA